MTLSQRLKQLRVETGMSQEALGAQGFVSAPGWIKIENGQRSPSERLIATFCVLLVRERAIPRGQQTTLETELMLLKYLGDRSEFVRRIAQIAAEKFGMLHLLQSSPAPKARRGRPVGTRRKAVAAR